MQNSIEAVVWDLGGVIVKTEDPSPRCELAKWLGITEHELYSIIFNSESARQATLGQIDEEEHWNLLQNHFELNDQDMLDLRNVFWSGDDLDRELMDFIITLRPKYRTALLSNAWSGTRMVMKARYNLLSGFDMSFFSAEIGLAKPDPAIYQYLLSELALSPEKVVFIDDMKENIDAAIAIGIFGIVFQNRKQLMEELSVLNILHA